MPKAVQNSAKDKEDKRAPGDPNASDRADRVHDQPKRLVLCEARVEKQGHILQTRTRLKCPRGDQIRVGAAAAEPEAEAGAPVTDDWPRTVTW